MIYFLLGFGMTVIPVISGIIADEWQRQIDHRNYEAREREWEYRSKYGFRDGMKWL